MWFWAWKWVGRWFICVKMEGLVFTVDECVEVVKLRRLMLGSLEGCIARGVNFSTLILRLRYHSDGR